LNRRKRETEIEAAGETGNDMDERARNRGEISKALCRRRRRRPSFEEQFSYDEWTE